MKEMTLTITLRLRGPVITAATEAGSFGTDLPFARTAAGQFYLPATLVKGRLRESLEKDLMPFVDVTERDLADWFGRMSSGSNDEPQRGRLVFGDFVLNETTQQDRDAIRTRVEMDTERGAVKKGAHLVIEAPFRSGELCSFTGSVSIVCGDEEFPRIQDAITKGLRWIPALGGQKSVGFGQLVGVQVDASQHPVPAEITAHSACDALSMQIYPKAPFCIAKPPVGDNLFESEDIIPGGAIKGCLADILNQVTGRAPNNPIDQTISPPWQDLGEWFSSIRFDHAFPTLRAKPNRPQRHPLSTVRANQETYDIALSPQPVLIDGQAPVFLVDWKSEDEICVENEFGWDRPPRILRVRTKIDRGTRRVDEGNLFAYEMIDPRAHVWHSRADLTAVPKERRSAVRAQLQALFQLQLKRLGKTKTEVDIRVSELPPAKLPTPLDDNLWVITLQTPALMLDPWNPDNPINTGLVDSGMLLLGYQEYWDEVSQGHLGLVRFLAQQKFLGRYLHYRFQTNKPYNPFLVTAERSTFVLKTKNASQMNETRRIIGMWLALGLPLPDWAIREYGNSWQTCPFVPENGFGEIAVNMACHVDRKPPAGIYEEVGYGS